MSDDFPFVVPKPSPCRQPPSPLYRRMRNPACAARTPLGSAFVQNPCSFYHLSPFPPHPQCRGPKEPLGDAVTFKKIKFQKQAKSEVFPKASLTPYFLLALYIAEGRLRKEWSDGWSVTRIWSYLCQSTSEVQQLEKKKIQTPPYIK